MVRCTALLDAQLSASHARRSRRTAKCPASDASAPLRVRVRVRVRVEVRVRWRVRVHLVWCTRSALQRARAQGMRREKAEEEAEERRGIREKRQKRQEESACGGEARAVRTGNVDGAVLAEQDVAGLDVPAARNDRGTEKSAAATFYTTSRLLYNVHMHATHASACACAPPPAPRRPPPAPRRPRRERERGAKRTRRRRLGA